MHDVIQVLYLELVQAALLLYIWKTKANTVYIIFSECYGALDCEWCVYDHSGSSKLSSPYCAEQRQCFNGVVGAKTPYGDEYCKLLLSSQ